MIATQVEAERLTVTFRFQDGSSDLDTSSVTNVRRLAEAIRRGEFEGKELLFVGFTDGEGPAEGNLRLSARRAASVRRAVAALSGHSSTTLIDDAFGEIMPIACDDTAWGRRLNRRVEVWLREPEAQRER